MKKEAISPNIAEKIIVPTMIIRYAEIRNIKIAIIIPVLP